MFILDLSASAVGGAGAAHPDAGTIRVRQLLSALNSVERTNLKKLLPKGLATSPPEEPEGTRYPAALLSALPKGEAYSLLGWITEDLLHYPPAEITPARLQVVATARCPALTPAAFAKVAASKTTEPFLEHIRQTRMKLRFAARGDFQFEAEVGAPGRVRGHPDMRTPTQIFEIKLTGMLKKNWVDFLFQAFAYAALAPETTDLYIVLPLQETVWHHDVRTWANRAAYRTFLEEAAKAKDETSGDALVGALLREAHLIGCHMPKLKSLVDTVRHLPDRRPYQIFLSGPQSSRMAIADAELAATRAAVEETGANLFVHSQYIINLCQPPGTSDDYHTALLIKNLQYGVAMGSRGVVVHVGKHTTQPLAAAMEHMRANIQTALTHATPECPLLLETPAGQGSEVLTEHDEFVDFVASFADPRLRICVDTCHVFACGHAPHDYVGKVLSRDPALLKLIHYNDSATPCGSRTDRHALVGQGHIGIPAMKAVAETATAAAVPMLVE
jgi:deoxyribonuclease-4